MTDRKAKELGYIDVSFVNLTEERERQERLHNVVRWVSIILASIAGFLFFPMMVTWETGDDVFASLYEWGNVPMAAIVLTVFATVGFLTGFVTYYITDRQD